MPIGWSRFRWRGNIEASAEITLLIKSTTSRYAELESEIKRLHPYDIPEIIGVPVAIGLP
jgi:periplasmic divalent cation tolerance protein